MCFSLQAFENVQNPENDGLEWLIGGTSDMISQFVSPNKLHWLIIRNGDITMITMITDNCFSPKHGKRFPPPIHCSCQSDQHSLQHAADMAGSGQGAQRVAAQGAGASEMICYQYVYSVYIYIGTYIYTCIYIIMYIYKYTHNYI